MLIAFLIALLLLAASTVYDVTATEKGLKAGVAIEGNTFLVGQHPTAVRLYLRDSLMGMLSFIPADIAYAEHSPYFWGALIPPMVYAFLHVRGGQAWGKLMPKGKK